MKNALRAAMIGL